MLTARLNKRYRWKGESLVFDSRDVLFLIGIEDICQKSLRGNYFQVFSFSGLIKKLIYHLKHFLFLSFIADSLRTKTEEIIENQEKRLYLFIIFFLINLNVLLTYFKTYFRIRAISGPSFSLKDVNEDSCFRNIFES